MAPREPSEHARCRATKYIFFPLINYVVFP
jgi:hypothetical protein